LIIQFQRKGFRFSIRLTVLAVFAIATLLTAAVAIGLQYHFTRAMAMANALEKYQASAANTRGFLSALDTNAHQVTRILARHPRLILAQHINPECLSLFSEVMLNNNLLYGIYIGMPNGAFYEVVNLESGNNVRQQFRALPEDRWVAISMQGQDGARNRRLEFYDRNLQLRTSRNETSDFDPRVRPWYSNANHDTVYKTRPYLFQYLQAPGQSYSMRLSDSEAVLAVDITLSSLSHFLATQASDNASEIYLFQPGGELIASNRGTMVPDPLPYVVPLDLSDEERAYIRSLGTIKVSNELDWPPIDYAVSAQPQGYAVDLLRLLGTMTGLSLEFVNGYRWNELVRLFEEDRLDILQPVFTNPAMQARGTLSRPFLQLPYAIVTRPQASSLSSLAGLDGKTVAVPSGWTILTSLRQHHPGIQILEVASTRAALQAVLEGKADATLDAAPVLHYTVDHYYLEGLQFHENIDVTADHLPRQLHLLLKSAQPQLIAIINRALAAVTPHAKAELAKKWFGNEDNPDNNSDNNSDKNPRNTLRNTVPYGELLTALETNHNELQELRLKQQDSFVYQAAINPQQPDSDIFAAVISADDLLAPGMTKLKISIALTVACLLVVLPFIWLFANPIVRPIRNLAIENGRIKNRLYDSVELHDSHIIEIYELSRSMVDMAVTIKQHEEAQKALMEALIQLIARAIDEKSPYTAGHCARVPELALMIAAAAEQSTAPPFAEFRFRNDDEYREFRIAAWLHDCGKITTPEHVVDKGTKLETIYNRIHEIRTRFEVLWRDAEIRYLQALAEAPQQQEILHQQLLLKRQQLQDDFAFIAQLNQGGETISEDALQRLQEIAMLTWQRHFDDGLGLSPQEQVRHPAAPTALPVTEPLLADRPEHIIEYEKPKLYPDHLHINMDIPEHLYNLGEIYNLSVARGTLTREDRFKIQEHMIGTIRMLDALPFPPELARVPRYASTHHETLDASGYPRRIGAEQLSIPERIMAVADIFEALTAADRPYKPAKPVSEAIAILHRMVLDQHIDGDVFRLFLSSGVYKDYAERYLAPEQLDPVPLDNYLADN